MKKLLYILKEVFRLVRQERLWSLTVVLVLLAVVAFFVYQVTPVAVVTFIYAGI